MATESWGAISAAIVPSSFKAFPEEFKKKIQMVLDLLLLLLLMLISSTRANCIIVLVRTSSFLLPLLNSCLKQKLLLTCHCKNWIFLLVDIAKGYGSKMPALRRGIPTCWCRRRCEQLRNIYFVSLNEELTAFHKVKILMLLSFLLFKGDVTFALGFYFINNKWLGLRV